PRRRGGAGALHAGCRRRARRLRARPPARGRPGRPDRRRAGPAARVARRGRAHARASHHDRRGDRVARVKPYATLRYDTREAVATVPPDRPEVLNAYNMAMRDDLHAVLAAADADPGIRVLVLRGRGSAFSTGGDLREFGSAPSPFIARQVRWQ